MQALAKARGLKAVAFTQANRANRQTAPRKAPFVVAIAEVYRLYPATWRVSDRIYRKCFSCERPVPKQTRFPYFAGVEYSHASSRDWRPPNLVASSLLGKCARLLCGMKRSPSWLCRVRRPLPPPRRHGRSTNSARNRTTPSPRPHAGQGAPPSRRAGKVSRGYAA